MKKTLLLLLILTVCQTNAQTTFQHEFPNGNRFIKSNSVIQNTDGSYYMVGSEDTLVNATQARTGFVKMTDSLGNLQWTRYYPIVDCYGLEFNKIIKTADSNFVVIGNYNDGFGIGPNFQDALICKIDPAGNMLWYKKYGGVGSDDGVDVFELQNHDLVMLASYGVEENLFVYNSFQLIYTDANGDSLWTKHYYNYDQLERFPTGFTATSDGGFLMVGGATNFNGLTNSHIIKTDSQGDTMWTKTISPNTNSEMINIFPNQGSVTIIGENDISFNEWKPVISNYSNSGILNWADTIFDNNINVVSAVQTADNGFAIACTKTDSLNPYTFVLKTDSLGNKLWEQNLNLSILYEPNEIVTTNDQALVITGTSLISSPSIHLTRIADSSLVPTNIPLLNNNRLLNVYPNPANEYIFIDITENDLNTMTSAYLTDIYGNKIRLYSKELINLKKLDLSDLDTGIYFLILRTENNDSFLYSKIIKK